MRRTNGRFCHWVALSGMCALVPRRGSARLRLLLRAARGGLRLRAHCRHRQPRSASQAGPRTIWRYRDLLPVSDDVAGRSRCRLHPPGAGRPPGGRARAGRAVDQGRHGQPDRVLQGPGGLGRPDQGAPARLQGGRLRVHRQSGQLGRRPRGPGRHGVGRPDPPRPRAGQGDHDHDLRGNRDRRRGHLRRRQPAVRRADQRASRAGPSSTSTCGPTTPRAPRRWPSRSPSSWAGRRPTTWWSRSARAAS